MKHSILVFLCLSSVRSLAQNGLYIMPLAGIGATNVITNSNIRTSRVLHYTGQINIGYQLNKWRLESGIRYFQTGYTDQEELLFEPNFSVGGVPLNMTDVNITRTYQHLAIPVCVGYELRLSHNLSLVPMAGILLGYNTSATSHVAEFSPKRRLSENEFDKLYNRYSIWGNVRLNIEYKATPRLNIEAVLQGDYMVSNVIKAPYTGAQHNYAASFNLGIRWSLLRA